MNSRLLGVNETLRIPEALALEHEELRADLIKATTVPGRIGRAAARMARLCHAHFAQEEQLVFSVFGLLHDLGLDRVRPDTAAVGQLAAQFGRQHDRLHAQYRSIDAVLDNLLQQARSEKNRQVLELVHKLRDHERLERQGVYPSVLQVARSVQERARI